METIANSGKLIKPGPVKQALAQAADDPYDVTIRCAPHYTGVANDMLVRRSWVPVAEKLVETGRHRALVSSARGGSKARQRTQIQDEIRRIWTEEADPVGMSVQEAATLLGVTRAALYEILAGRVGGAGRRGTDPAERPKPGRAKVG